MVLSRKAHFIQYSHKITQFFIWRKNDKNQVKCKRTLKENPKHIFKKFRNCNEKINQNNWIFAKKYENTFATSKLLLMPCERCSTLLSTRRQRTVLSFVSFPQLANITKLIQVFKHLFGLWYETNSIRIFLLFFLFLFFPFTVVVVVVILFHSYKTDIHLSKRSRERKKLPIRKNSPFNRSNTEL